MKKRGAIGIDKDKIGYFIIILAVLALVLSGYLILRVYLNVDVGEYIKNLFRFRR